MAKNHQPQPLHWIKGFPNEKRWSCTGPPVRPRGSPGPRSFPSRSWGVSTLRRPMNWIDPRLTSKCESNNGALTALKQETWGSDQEMGVFRVLKFSSQRLRFDIFGQQVHVLRRCTPRAGKRKNFWELESVRNSSWENLVHCNDLLVMVG